MEDNKEHREIEYGVKINMSHIDSTFGIDHPVRAILIYVSMLMAMVGLLTYNIWMHNVTGIILFFILQMIWRAKARNKLGIPQAHVQLLDKTDG